MSEVVEADAEPRFGIVAMEFSRVLFGADAAGRGFAGPGHSRRQHADQQVDFLRVGEAGILKVETAGFGVAEQALDRPASAIGLERRSAIAVRRDDQPFAARQALGGEFRRDGRVGPSAV